MKRAFVFFVAVMAVAGLALAQEALWSAPARMVSPEVHPDGSVTFRYVAPTAKSVKGTGDFLTKTKMET